MKNIIAFSILTLLLSAGIGHADVAPGMQQEGASLFEQMDQNADGTVSQGEFEQYSLEEQDKTQLFAIIDQNGDGMISESEWQSYKEGGAMQPRAAEEPAMEQPMSPEEESVMEDEETSERAYGSGVENKQRRILDEKMSRGSEQQ
ncbi:MAG: EF-hand domain-containing protein [Desulfocurvibacter africanus]